MQIDTHDFESLVNVWEIAMVFYVVGENTTIDVVRDKGSCPNAYNSQFHIHDKGYYIYCSAQLKMIVMISYREAHTS